MEGRVGMYLGSNSLQRPRSTARGSHILAFTTPRVLSPLDEPLVCSEWMGASYYPRFLVNTRSPIIESPPIGCSIPEARQRVDNLNHPSRVLFIRCSRA